MPKILSSVDGTGIVDADLGFRHGDPTKPSWTTGTGSPEGAINAPIGSLFSRVDGSTNTAIYRKEAGTGNTGWVATSTTSGVGTFVQIAGDTMTGSLGMGIAPTSKLHFAADTTAAGGIQFGTDTNLYRSATDTLSTDDNFQVGATPGFLAQPGARVSIGTTPSQYVHLEIYTASGTAGQLSSSLPVYGLRSRPVNKGTGNVRAVVATAGSEVAGTVGSLSAVETATQTYAASTAVTDSRGVSVLSPTLVAGSTMTSAYGVDIQPQKVTGVTNAYAFFQRGASDLNYFAANLGLGQTVPTAKLEFAAGTTAAGGISFGADTNLYRSAVDTLKTDDYFDVGSSTKVRLDPTGLVRIAQSALPTLGAELIVNGDLATDLTGWTVGAGWSWDSGTALHATGNVEALTQTVPTVNGTTYLINVTAVGRTAGSVQLSWGGVLFAGGFTTGRTVTMRATGATTDLSFIPTTDFNGALDNISVKPLATVRPPHMYFDAGLLSQRASITVYPGYGNIGFGDGALRYGSVSGTLARTYAFGAGAGANINSGSDNVMIGYYAGLDFDAGNRNVFIGSNAGLAARGDSDVTAIGYGAYQNSTSGAGRNTVVGSYAMQLMTTGSYNAAFGAWSGNAITTGTRVSCLGDNTGRNVSTASYGTYVGYNANITGVQADGQTAVGASTLTGGANSMALGYLAQANAAGAVAIGRDSANTSASTTTQDEILVGTTLHTVRVPGSVGIGIAPTAKLQFVASTTAAGGILFGTDTNLYRSAANILKTDDQFSCAGANFNQNEIQNVVSHKLATAPSTPVEGQRYYDTILKLERYWDGTKWSDQTDVWVGADAPTGTPSVGDQWYDTDEVSGLTLPLTLANGGTGGTSAATARSSLSTALVGNSGSTAGPPSAGTYVRGDQWLDSSNVFWVCTVAGSPGTWVSKNQGEELFYGELTDVISVTGTSGATSQLVLDSSTRTYDGTPTRIEFYAPVVTTPVTVSSQIVFKLYDGATDLGNVAYLRTPAAVSHAAPISVARRLTPTAGPHNYLIRAFVTAGTGSVSAGPGGTTQAMPAYLRITRA